ncbi:MULTISPECIES: sugar ABC transporter substrate-binding protein [Pseudomonas]|jgi:ribose transport system substrate-binding protein|uniref:Sugar ABC transporter substrate-binding protein n=2 Tax=Pseudomonas putida group TaxID=136845 RepID=A0A2A3M3E2_PSEDL|nr:MULTISPECIES: sugar ABC transporter substrate-binding protein [Pseudomonas]AHC81983.1 LacI family transcriptional regulator [Pseudomonas monteilii SB3078]AHC87360.1 LacI family transcriptional regulator [Pseudomonas monteilii SB3101]AHZ76789.1 monosaccharide-transporting ATPase [Pseudomonas putida]KAF4559176.1 sugar ABC transporter substrate-binding protein [Pseudomonas sp. CES]KGK25055.1 LacI family transcriptional regulator [Pseudomonas plecoglossicida]
MKLPFPGRLLALAVISSLSLALPFSPAHAEDKPKVALVMKSLANEFFRTMEDGAKDYQKAHADEFELIANGIKNETDTGEQIRIVEQMVNAGAKALVIAPADSKALVSAVKKAMDQGVVVINIDNRLDPALLKSKGISVPFVGPDNRKGARLVGDYLANEKLKAGDQVGIIEGVPTTTNAQQRTAGFKDAMDAAQIKIVSVQSGNWEIDKGNAVAASMLNEYPDLKALLAGNDSMALGAVSAVRAAGKTGQVQVVGYDNINAIKPMLADGRVLATLDQAASQQAVYGIQAALKMVKGEKPDVDADNVIQTPVQLITKP